MSETRPSCPDDDYEAIETALAQTARGRGFMAELARRSRGDDTRTLLDAIARLERRVAGVRVAEEMDRLRRDLGELTDTIGRTRGELVELSRRGGRSFRLSEASEALDSVVQMTERATCAILDATEQVQETAWTMREGGFDPALCDALDQRATEIYAACAFHDLTAQGIDRVVRSLTFIEERIGVMNEAWGVGPGRPPPTLERVRPVLSQEDIDFVIVDPKPAPADAEAHRAEAAGQGLADFPDDRAVSRVAALRELERIAGLPLREQLSLLT